MKTINLLVQALQVMQAQQEWIDAVPQSVVLPTMPGFDRDWADGVQEDLKQATTELAKPVKIDAWLIPHIQTFKDALKVHFSRVPSCTLSDSQLMEELEGTVMWTVSLFDTETVVVDKLGVTHYTKPLVKLGMEEEVLELYKKAINEETIARTKATLEYKDGVIKVLSEELASLKAKPVDVDTPVKGDSIPYSATYVDPAHLRVDVVYTRDGGGFAPLNEHGIRITHTPTGLTTVSTAGRSQHRNKELAYNELMKLLLTWGTK